VVSEVKADTGTLVGKTRQQITDNPKRPVAADGFRHVQLDGWRYTDERYGFIDHVRPMGMVDRIWVDYMRVSRSV